MMVSETVECHSGYTYGERPTAFYWEEVRLCIAEIEAFWRTPDGRKFRVRTEDDRIFELSYDALNDAWQILLP